MGSVRVLVGTAKGAFILSADGKREAWDIAGHFFCRLDGLPYERVAPRPQPDLRIAMQ